MKGFRVGKDPHGSHSLTPARTSVPDVARDSSCPNISVLTSYHTDAKARSKSNVAPEISLLCDGAHENVLCISDAFLFHCYGCEFAISGEVAYIVWNEPLLVSVVKME